MRTSRLQLIESLGTVRLRVLADLGAEGGAESPKLIYHTQSELLIYGINIGLELDQPWNWIEIELILDYLWIALGLGLRLEYLWIGFGLGLTLD